MENKPELLKVLNYSINYSETTKLSDLAKQVPYEVVELRKINKYGTSLIVTLRDGEYEITNVFLPRRFVNLLNDDQIKFINENEFHMTYYGGQYHNIGFS
jgi:hypothetical protein